MLGQSFKQGKTSLRKGFFNALDDKRVIQRILQVIGQAGLACWKGDFQIKLYRLSSGAFPRIDSNQGFDLEFVQENNIHYRNHNQPHAHAHDIL
jgi:hypothetical protein